MCYEGELRDRLRCQKFKIPEPRFNCCNCMPQVWHVEQSGQGTLMSIWSLVEVSLINITPGCHLQNKILVVMTSKGVVVTPDLELLEITKQNTFQGHSSEYNSTA